MKAVSNGVLMTLLGFTALVLSDFSFELPLNLRRMSLGGGSTVRFVRGVQLGAQNYPLVERGEHGSRDRAHVSGTRAVRADINRVRPHERI